MTGSNISSGTSVEKDAATTERSVTKNFSPTSKVQKSEYDFPFPDLFCATFDIEYVHLFASRNSQMH